MYKFFKYSLFFIFIIHLFFIFASCEKKKTNENLVFHTFRNIPGITSEEIAFIETMKSRVDHFTFGMIPSTDAFVDANGETRGYSALLCEWLTEFFGIPFVLEQHSWLGLLDGLETEKISFTGDLTANDERRKTYIMTDAIAQRSIKFFRLADDGNNNYKPLSEIRKTRLPVYILQEKTTIASDVLTYAGGTFEPLFIKEYDEAYDLLKNGQADALITEDVQEAYFDKYGDIIVEDFFPLIYSPVSFSTQNPELEPFVSVLQKALDSGGIRHLNKLHDDGYKEYLKFKYFLKLTEEEREYINNNPVVRFGAEFDNYPVSFFSEHNNEWQGISIDALKKIQSFTGLRFEIVNKKDTEFHELLEMLENGKIQIVSELINTTEREGRFIWPSSSFMTERSVLLSNLETPNININKIYSVRVGSAKGTAHSELFSRWFPNHSNSIVFESQADAFDALMNGKVDMVMCSYSTLLYFTNYLELPGFKANVMFDNSFESTFGINKDQPLLCSIIDKALALTDTKTISEQWRHKTYDYRLKLAQAQTPWFIGSIGLSLIVLSLVAVLLIRSRLASKEMEDLVQKRTYELALQTTTLTTLFDSIPDLIFTKNLDLNFLHCNKAFLQHFNKEIDDVVGKSDGPEMGMTEKEAEAYIEVDAKVILERRTITVEEYIPRYDGKKPFYETIKMPLLLDGNVVGIMGISRDITERKKFEDSMTSSYEYSNKLSDALSKITKSQTISAGILKEAAAAVAKEGCNALNAHRVGIWSYSESENVLSCISSYDTFTSENTIHESFNLTNCQEYKTLLKSERLIVMNNPFECRLISDSFEGYDFLCAALDAPIRVDGQLVGVVCVEQWLSKQFLEKREWTIEEQNFASSLADLMALAVSGSERHKAREAAEMANQTKSAFLANMSHEIRTPMNAILGVTELMIQNEKLPVEIEEGLDKIYSSCDLLLGIINDILDFSKIEANKLDIMPTQYKVASMINDSIHLNMMKIESKPITFELQIDENIPAKLIGDELRIKQILNNLLSNAFKYTDFGKVVLSVSVESIPLLSYLPEHMMTNQVKWLGHDKKGITLVLSVRDTGHGMNNVQLSKMFDEYSRFNREKNITIEGTGLGLAITRRLVSLMDGTIGVESEPKIGSLFVVRLPQEIVDDEIIGKDVVENLCQFRRTYMTHRKRNQIVRNPMPYGNVLIVDDVETNIYVAVGLMKLYKLQIDSAMNAQEAIDKIKKGNYYDVIFMDHMMPEIDGIEATKIIRDFGYSSPIVALTANAVAGQADVFLQNGFDDFISKPIDIRQLDAILNKFIHDKQPPEVIEAARRQSAGSSAAASEDSSPRSDIDFYLLESFLRDANKTILWLEERRRGSDFEDEETVRKFTIIVHGIKSSLWNINEPELAELAYKLEKCGRELSTVLSPPTAHNQIARSRNVDLIREEMPEFLNQLRVLAKKFEEIRDEERKRSHIHDEDIEDLINKLKAIQNKCANYNRKGSLNLISEIKNCSKETMAILDNIKERILHSEFEEADVIAQEFITKLSADISAPKPKSMLLDKKIQGLDIARGLDQYEGNEQTYLKILHSYSFSVSSLLDAMETVSKDNLDNYRIKVHGIKGTSLDICAEKLGNEAKALEDAAKAGNFDYINEHNSAFLESAWKLVNDINKMLAELEAENPKPKKDKLDEAVLVKLLGACKEYDINEADKAMAEIEKYKYEADDGLADWLRGRIDRMDYKQIVQKLVYLDK